jgi:CRP-like cAMP-binding protein
MHNIYNKYIDPSDMLATSEDMTRPFYLPFLMHMELTSPVHEDAKKMIAQHCKLVKFGKGDRLLNIGCVCKFVYFIISGECVSYYTDKSGKTKTWFFHFHQSESNVKNLFAVDYNSFISGKPSSISIDALSPVTAIRFSVKEVQILKQGSRSIERWLDNINEQAYIQTHERITTLLTLSAVERYEKLLATEPYLLKMFSNYLVATYLNVAPQSLSRIRREIASGR